MGLFTDLPIRQASNMPGGCRRVNSRPIDPASRRTSAAGRGSRASVVRPMPVAQPTTPGAFYGGFRLMGIDSTVYDVPDTPANDTAFGRPSAGPRGDGAFPQVPSSVWSNWEPTSKSAWFSEARPLR